MSDFEETIYVFDLDGTICTEVEGMQYQHAEPIPEVVDLVNSLHDEGHRIVIDTARGSVSGHDWYLVTRQQLERWGVSYDELRVGEKTPGHVYVDDRAMRPRELIEER